MTPSGFEEGYEARRQAALEGLKAGGGSVRQVAPLIAPHTPGFKPGTAPSRDNLTLTVTVQPAFLWKDLVAKLDDQGLGFVEELIEIERARRGVRNR